MNYKSFEYGWVMNVKRMNVKRMNDKRGRGEKSGYGVLNLN